MAGIAFDDDGTLFAIDVDFGSTTLFVVHPGTGATTAIGTTGTTAGEGALAWSSAAGVLYSKSNPISGGGPFVDLIQIDPGTGAASVIGNMGLVEIEADPSGLEVLGPTTLLAWDAVSALPDRMLSIDTTTGAATVIGPTGFSSGSSVGGVPLDPDSGTYYMSDGVDLHTVDETTGTATAIGPHGQLISGLSFGPDRGCLIGFDSMATLYDVNEADGTSTNARATGWNLGSLAMSPSTGTLYATLNAGNSALYEVDIATGEVTGVGPLLIEQIEGGLDFHPTSGVLYGVNGDGYSRLFTIDTTTVQPRSSDRSSTSRARRSMRRRWPSMPRGRSGRSRRRRRRSSTGWIRAMRASSRWCRSRASRPASRWAGWSSTTRPTRSTS